jgi:2'-5' RNA ligase
MKEDSQEGEPPECCGNAGPVETVENQTTVSHRSHRPLEIAKDAISTFPQHRQRFLYIPIANNARAFQALAIEGENQKKGAIRSCPPDVEKAFHLRAHPALESKSSFRLISRWNEFSISGSFVDWKMLKLPDSRREAASR